MINQPNADSHVKLYSLWTVLIIYYTIMYIPLQTYTQCCLCDLSRNINILTFLNVQCGKVSTLPHTSSWILIFANRKQKQKQWINFKTNATYL